LHRNEPEDDMEHEDENEDAVCISFSFSRLPGLIHRIQDGSKDVAHFD
jgi:hypothetical protein